MEFNIKKYLMENKLGKVSSLNEDGQPTLADLGRGAKPNQDLEVGNDDEFDNAPELDVAPQADVAPQSEADDEDATFDVASADPFGGNYTTKGSNWDDNPGKADYFKTQNGADYDREPGANNLKVDRNTKNLQSTESKLQALVDQKDKVLMQYKSGQMSLDQYKEAIGNIPQQIKRLRDRIDQAMNVSVDDNSEDDDVMA